MAQSGLKYSIRYLLLLNIFIVIVYLISANYTSSIAKISIQELIVGRAAFAFWLGVIILGLIVPGVISLSSLSAGIEASVGLLLMAVVSHTLGAFALKYCLLRVGVYRPLFPRTAAY